MNMQHYAAPMKFITICANRQQNVRNAGLSMWQYIPSLIFILFLTFEIIGRPQKKITDVHIGGCLFPRTQCCGSGSTRIRFSWADPLPEMDPQHCSHIQQTSSVYNKECVLTFQICPLFHCLYAEKEALNSFSLIIKKSDKV